MKTEHRIPAKALSLLLALAMLIGCVSVGLTALAVEDSYQVLADALRADGITGVIPSYNASASPDVKNNLQAQDPKASSAVYVQSAAMWAAMDAFWEVAKSVRSSDVGDIVVGDNGNVYSGWTGENNTARKIASAVAGKLVSDGYMTSEELLTFKVLDNFNWFIGGFTAEHALLDEPVRGEKPTLLPWTHQVFGSTGYFGVTRTRDDALLSGTSNYKQIPATLELNRRWAWTHDARNARNADGNVRQYWHVLSGMETKGNVAGAMGLAFDPAQADTAALKAALADWDKTFTDAFFKQNLSVMGEEQLGAILDEIAAMFALAEGLKLTNSLLYFYGLPTFLDAGDFRSQVEYHLTLAPYRPAVAYFNNSKSAGKLGGMSDDALAAEMLAARQNYEQLLGVSLGNKAVYSGLQAENGLNMASIEDYLGVVTQALTDTDRDALVGQIKTAIDTYLVHTAAPYKLKAGSYDDVTAAQLYAAYELILMNRAALTGSVGSQVNFPAPFNLNTALADAPGPVIAIQAGQNQADLALAALMNAIREKNLPYYNYFGNKPDIITGAVNTTFDLDAHLAGLGIPAGAQPVERYTATFEAARPTITSPNWLDPKIALGGDPATTYPTAGLAALTALGWVSDGSDATATPYATDAAAIYSALTAPQIALINPALVVAVTGAVPPAPPAGNDAYAAALQAAIADLEANYATFTTNNTSYNATVTPAQTWVTLYETTLLTVAAPAVPPDREAAPYTVGGVVDHEAFITAMEAYIAGLTPVQTELLNVPPAPSGPSPEQRAAYSNELFGYALSINMPAGKWNPNGLYPDTGTLQAKYNYLMALKDKAGNAGLYDQVKQEQLSMPLIAWNYLVSAQVKFEAAVEANDGTPAAQIVLMEARAELAIAAGNYNDRLANFGVAGGFTADGTTLITGNSADFAINGLAGAAAAYKAIEDSIATLTQYRLFFNAYRLSLSNDATYTDDWSRYSDEDLRKEYTDTKAKLDAYKADTELGSPTPPAAWSAHFGNEDGDGTWNAGENPDSIQGAIRVRVKALVDVLAAQGVGDTKKIDDFLKDVDPTSGQFKIGAITYNVNTIALWPTINGTDYGAELDVTLAQRVLAAFRGLTVEFETMHWDLNGGVLQPFGATKDWLPVRGVEDNGASIALVVGQDEFKVRYEHIENLINKLDTILTSKFGAELLGDLDLFSSAADQPGSAADEPGTQAVPADGKLPKPQFKIPDLDGDILMALGEMRYSINKTTSAADASLEITNEFTGIKVILPPLDTQRDTDRVLDADLDMYAQRRWIQAYRADVLLYLLHFIFEAINTDTTDGWGMLSWILKLVLKGEADDVNGNPSSEYAPAAPAEVQKSVGDAVTQALSGSVGKLELDAAVKPFLTELLGGLVSDNLYGDMLPNTVIGLYKMVCDMVAPILEGSLLDLMGGDMELFAGLTLGDALCYLLDVPTTTNLTINQVLGSNVVMAILGLGGATGVTSLLEIVIGAEITPKDMIAKCWPADWPTTTATAPAGAPDYVTEIAQYLSDIYNWLNDPGNFGGVGTYGSLNAWQGLTTADIEAKLVWGMDTITDAGDQRQAFEDIMAFSMSGIAFLLAAVFGDTGLNVKFGDQLNPGGKVDDQWYFDIVIPMDWLNTALKTITFGLWNPNIDDIRISNWFGDNSYSSDSGWPHWKGKFDSRSGLFATLDPVNAYGKLFIPLFEMLNIDPILFGEYEAPTTADFSDAYFAAMGVARPAGGAYSEKSFNQLMAAYSGEVGKVIRALNAPTAAGTEGITKAEARRTFSELSRILVSSLLEPLLNWIDPVNDPDLVPYSIGFRPVGKVLDLLPNLAFVVEKGLIPKLVNEVLDGLILNVDFALGGVSGSVIQDLLNKIMPSMETLLMNWFSTAISNAVGGGTLGKILGYLGVAGGWLAGKAIGAIGGLATLIVNLFKDQDTGRSSLGMFLGFFAGDSLANSLTIPILDDWSVKTEVLDGLLTYKPEECTAKGCNTPHPDGIFGYLDHMIGIDLTGKLNDLIQGAIGLIGIENPDEAPVIDADPEKQKAILGIIDNVVQNESHIEGFLIELFNPQTYPSKTFMIYPMVSEAAKAGGAKLNEVNYGDIWTAEKANFLNDHLMEFLDKLWDFLFAKPFLPWLWETLKGSLGFDISNLYTQANFDAIMEMIGGLLANVDLSGILNGEGIMGTIMDLLPALQDFVNVNDLLTAIDVLKDYGTGASANPDAQTVINAVKALNLNSREGFSGGLYKILAPLASVLKIFLTGGRTTDAKGKLIETLWYGELYPNNGAKDLGYFKPGGKVTDDDDKDYVWNYRRYLKVSNTADNYTVGAITPNAWSKVGAVNADYAAAYPDGYDPDDRFLTISAEGNNLTLIEDYLGFSGYDGYRHAVIPIFEHLGVPKEDIPNYQQFVLRSTEGAGGYTGNEMFFKMLVDPILNLVDRVVDDPINTVINILPNLLYFITAEASTGDQAYATAKYGDYTVLSGTTALNECLNRLLRPVYAILDMLAPLYTVDEIFAELLPAFGVTLPENMFPSGGLPLEVEFSGVKLSINLPIQISINDIVGGLLDSLLGDALGGLTLELNDLTSLICGELQLYKSQNGQDDAVRLEGNLPDLLTHLIRKLLELVFTPANYDWLLATLQGAGVPDALWPAVKQLLDNVYGLMTDRTLQGHIGADLVLSLLFYLFYDANSLVDELLWTRDTYSARIMSMFELIANSSSPQLRRYAERARRLLNLYYSDIITPDEGVQKSGFIKFITDFWAKITGFFTSIGDWFMNLLRWIFPFFF